MKKIFRLEDYPYPAMKQVGIHCTTNEEWNDCREKLKSTYLKWRDKANYLDHGWFSDTFLDRNIYVFNKGDWTDYRYAKEHPHQYTILEWSDFMENKTFTKSDLKNFDRVTLRNGEVYTAIVDAEILCNQSGFIEFSNYSDDLKYSYESPFYKDVNGTHDVITVRRPKTKFDYTPDMKPRGEIVYERKETVEMTLEEVCKQLGKTIKIVPNKEKS